MRLRLVPAFLVMIACGRSELDSPALEVSITPEVQTVRVGEVALWSGASSADDDQAVLFAWRIFARPSGARSTLSTSGASAELRPDQPGEWVIELQGADERRRSQPVWARLVVEPGVATGVTDGGLTTLDAGAVYLAGTLSEGTCPRGALADIFTPNVASIGFSCDFVESSAVIRPGDGVLLYFNDRESLIREYHCDDCAVTSGRVPYPADVLANDTVLSAPCTGTGDRLTRFLVSPQGEVLHQCLLSSSSWRDSTGTAVHTNIGSEPLLSLCGGGWALTRSRLVNWRTRTVARIMGLPPSFTLLAARALSNGFWMALRANGAETLWHVDFSGVMTRVGTYGALPPNTMVNNVELGGRLDSTGRLFQVGSDSTTTFSDLVVMKRVGQPSTIVYSEATNPLVKIHFSMLVTGP